MSESDISILFKYNCSSIFLLYPLGIERRKIKQLGFVEAYLRDSERMVEYTNAVFLLFKPENPALLQLYIDSEYERLNKHTQTLDLVEDYDYTDGYVVMVYQIPKEFEEDYKKFLEGKYSKFSKKFKETYPKTVKIKLESGQMVDEPSSQHRMINKAKELKATLEEYYDMKFEKDQEYWSKPNMDKETLSYNKIKELK